jgi:hypothetical protein
LDTSFEIIGETLTEGKYLKTPRIWDLSLRKENALPYEIQTGFEKEEVEAWGKEARCYRPF